MRSLATHPALLAATLLLASPAWALGADDGVGLFDRANRAFVFERYGEALRLYQEVLQEQSLEEHHDDALFLMARCHNERDEWPHAQTALNQLMADHPESDLQDNAFYFMGNHYASEGQSKDIPAAMKNFRILLERFPTGDKAHAAAFRLGELATETGAWSEAIQVFTALTEQELPEKLAFDTRFALAEAYRNPRNMQRDLAKALELLDDLSDRFPERANAPKVLFVIGSTYRDLGQHDLAIKHLDGLLREYPNSLFASVAGPLLAKCYEERQKKLVSELTKLMRTSARVESGEQAPSQQAMDFISVLQQAVREQEELLVQNGADEAQRVIVTAMKEDGERWQGNVTIVFNDVSIKADEVSYDEQEKRFMARGNVSLRRGDLLEASGNSLTYSLQRAEVQIETQVVVRRKGEEDYFGDQVLLSLADNSILPRSIEPPLVGEERR